MYLIVLGLLFVVILLSVALLITLGKDFQVNFERESSSAKIKLDFGETKESSIEEDDNHISDFQDPQQDLNETSETRSETTA